MVEVDVRVLGPLEVWIGGSRVEIGAPRERALLSLLALAAPSVVAVDRIVDELWERDPPASSVQSVRVWASRLRRALGEGVLVSRAPGYTLQSSQTDASRFAELVDDAKAAAAAGDPSRSASAYRTALRLWRGSALADVATTPSLRNHATRLEAERLDALEGLVAAELDAGRHGEWVSELSKLCAENPLRERLWVLQMLALYRSGRQAEALDCYEELRKKLGAELGIDPSLEVRGLHQAILEQRAALEAPVSATLPAGRLRTAKRLPNNLPAQLTTFVGRKGQLANLRERIAEERLLTLTGAGGAGKTRLALELAGEALADFRHGVWLVDLAPLADQTLVPYALAEVLGVSEEQGKPVEDSVVDHLRSRELLLILDNCEHLVEASAGLCRRLLRDVPSLRVVVTSREPLTVEGEVVWRVPSLEVPPEGADPAEIGDIEAVALFCERASHVDTGFAPTADDLGVVADICRHLDGMPLAIELAAARVRVLTPAEIAHRLDDRFQLLTGGARGGLRRQQTLRAAVDWSYDLCSEAEKALFRRLSAFVGGFTLLAAEEVGFEDSSGKGGVLDTLGTLVDRSLVTAENVGSGKRYRLLETMREYGREKLLDSGEAPRVWARHLAYFVQLAEEAEPSLRGRRDRVAWMARIDEEIGNVRQALHWATSGGDPALGLRLATALYAYWEPRGKTGEGLHWVQSAFQKAADIVSPLKAKALLVRGNFAGYHNDMEQTRSDLEACRELPYDAGAGPWIAEATVDLGTLARWEGDVEAARTLYEEALAICREIGDRSVASLALLEFARLCVQEGDVEGARTRIEESLAISRALGHAEHVAHCLEELGNIAALTQGHLDDTSSLLEEALEIWRELGDRPNAVSTLHSLGNYMRVRGEIERARAFYEEALRLAEEIESPLYAGSVLGGLAGLALYYTADLETAERLYQEALDLWPLAMKEQRAGLIISLGIVAHEGMDFATARVHYEEGVRLSEEAGVPTTALGNLGYLTCHEGDPAAARPLVQRSLEIAIERGSAGWASPAYCVLGAVACAEGHLAEAASLHAEALKGMNAAALKQYFAWPVEGLADAALAAKDAELAARLCGAADAIRAEAGTKRRPREIWQHEARLVSLRETLDPNAVEAAISGGRAMRCDEAVAYALTQAAHLATAV